MCIVALMLELTIPIVLACQIVCYKYHVAAIRTSFTIMQHCLWCSAHWCHMFVFCLLCEDELSSSSESSTIAGYSSVSIESPSITPTTTPQSPCMCNGPDFVCYSWVCFLLQTVPLVGVFLFVVSTSVIIVTVLVVIVCLLFVVKHHKHWKNSPGEDYTLLLMLQVFVHCCCFSIAPIDHVYWKQTTTESRFV